MVGPYIGSGYRHDGNTDKGTKSATFRAKLKPGRYEVRVAYTANDNRAAAIPVRVHHANGIASVKLNEKKSPPKAAAPFVSIGSFDLNEKAAVEILNEGTTGHVIIDAVQFLKAPR